MGAARNKTTTRKRENKGSGFHGDSKNNNIVFQPNGISENY